ncbi:cupredoxin domain-containing protein [Mesorhizobium sp. ORM6]
MKMRAWITTVLAGVVLGSVSFAVMADDNPTFRIEFKDGAISPLRLEVPANTRVRFELINLGDMPAEFESLELRKERVVAPHSETVMVIRTLDPGQYPFFDDFHPGAGPAVLVAK